MVSEKRRRGRPAGTVKFADVDGKRLSTYSDHLILAPDTGLATFFKSQGWCEEKEVRRAQLRWRQEKAQLLAAARMRATETTSVFAIIALVVEQMSALQKSATTGITMIAESFERERLRWRKLAAQGLPPTIDLDDEAKVAAAIQRYEAGIHAMPAEFHELGLSELSLPQKLYLAAHMLHEFSITITEDPELSQKFGGNHDAS